MNFDTVYFFIIIIIFNFQRLFVDIICVVGRICYTRHNVTRLLRLLGHSLVIRMNMISRASPLVVVS